MRDSEVALAFILAVAIAYGAFATIMALTPSLPGVCYGKTVTMVAR